ncbi:GNAT family N-acetyltransferase [Tropicimonas sp.]|uniref:GNAT family N-acetyltransferase n=1 Tax=Tropicimonas sp. TaxID=2067044 RepID=UPI003A83961A
MRIVRGFPEEQRAQVARLFWLAFADKLARIMAPEDRALAFVEATLDPGHALSAQSADGHLLGVAGFKTPDGGLISAGFRDMRRFYGLAGALWRGPLLDLTERPLAPGELLMDGLFVAAAARGQGVGSALIEAIQATARARGCESVRLDVIDRNHRARALYERHGFIAVGRTQTGVFARVFGYRHATVMRCALT